MNIDRLQAQHRLQTFLSACLPVGLGRGATGLGRALIGAMIVVAQLGVVAAAQGPERLYLLDRQSGAKLVRLDPASGSVLTSVSISGPIVYWNKLAWNGQRILVNGNTNWNADRLVISHPSDAATRHLQPIPAPWTLAALEFDPALNLTRAIITDFFGNYRLIALDPDTGAILSSVVIQGMANPMAMAIDGTGRVIVAQGSAYKFFELDPATGAGTLLGSVAVPNSLWFDLAFDGNDQLWGLSMDQAGGGLSGVYSIDLSTLTPTLVHPTHPYNAGIAFVQETSTQTFCTPKLSSLNCMPTLSADGIASPTAALGFTVRATTLNNNRVGMLLYSTNGRAAIPFQGGLLCVQPPVHRSPAGTTGGNPLPTLDCSGSWSIDYNELIWTKYQNPAADRFPAPLQTPGTTVQFQWWGRDPGFAAPNNSMLSDGLEFVLAP